MTVIDMRGFNTQLEPMKAIDEVANDWQSGVINSKEALAVIYAIVCEWRA
jgi:hypothetical protein